MGAWQDDAIYVATATSLASGGGYRHAEIPGEPLQAKYPIAYPALLAVLWMLAPEYPGNVPLLLLPTSLSAAFLVVGSFLYWRRYFAPSPRELVVLGALWAASPAIVSMVRFTMSDLVYAALSLAAIARLDGMFLRSGQSSPPTGSLALTGLLIGGATLTRSIGLTLLLGAVLHLLWRREVRDALIVGGVAAALIAPWHAWQLWASGVNADLYAGTPLGTLLLSELNYGVWAPGGVGDVVRVVFQNVFHVAFGLLYFQLAIPEWLGAAALAGLSWQTLALHVAGFASLLAVTTGFAVTARNRLRAVHWCALPYALVVLAYPGDPYRFLLPWTPFLLGFLGVGVNSALRRIGVGRAARHATLGAGALVLALLFAFELARIVASTDADYHFRVTPQNWADMRELEAQVRSRTQPGDAIASSDFATLYLATGRQGYFLWPIVDPYALFYGADRTWWSFFVAGGEAGAAKARAQVRGELESAYRAGGVDWYVDSARPDVLAAAVRAEARNRPGRFDPRHLTERGMFRLYRVRRR